MDVQVYEATSFLPIPANLNYESDQQGKGILFLPNYSLYSTKLNVPIAVVYL